jgi:CubicO group peptidase (beta-lactamase class C family)
MTTLNTSHLESFYPHAAEPGACLVVVHGGEIIHQECRGAASVHGESTLPVTLDTNFRLASVAKQFTAACILLLRERNAVTLATALTDLFPGFPDYGREITIQHLLTHTSGLKDYEDLLPPDLATPIVDAGVLDIMQHQTDTYFVPGDQFRYSNSGYALLAMAVERISGVSFPHFLRENIFEPLGMTGTLAYVNGTGLPDVPNRAFGYRKTDAGFELADQNMTSSVLGDGGIYCSAKNYLVWHKALREGSLLPASVVEQAITPAQANNGEPVPYGFGWRLETHNGRFTPYHPGSTTGFNHCVRWVPSEDFLLLLFANRSGAGSRELARELEGAFLP